MTLTFYTNPMSRGRIVHWMLEEVGATYDTVVLDFATTAKTPDYLALNPMGKVPTLVHDGEVITECAAICLWLAETYPAAGLMPQDHGAAYRWLFFGAGPLEQAVVNTSFGWSAPDPRSEGRTGYGSLARVVKTLAGHLSHHDFFCGDFSVVDVYVGSQIGWGLQFGSLPADPVLQSYYARIKDRPALARANALCDAMGAK